MRGEICNMEELNCMGQICRGAAEKRRSPTLLARVGVSISKRPRCRSHALRWGVQWPHLLADEGCCPVQSAFLQQYSIYLFMISVGGVLDDLLSQSEIFWGTVRYFKNISSLWKYPWCDSCVLVIRKGSDFNERKNISSCQSVFTHCLPGSCCQSSVSVAGFTLLRLCLLFYFLTRNKINPLMDIGSYELINCQ